MDRSKDGNCRQQNSSLFHRASLTKTKEATSGFQVGIPITNVGKGLPWIVGTAARGTG